jgi:hypothetical protein
MRRSKTLVSSSAFVFTMTLMFGHLAWMSFGPYAKRDHTAVEAQEEYGAAQFRAEYARLAPD